MLIGSYLLGGARLRSRAAVMQQHPEPSQLMTSLKQSSRETWLSTAVLSCENEPESPFDCTGLSWYIQAVT